MRKMINYLCVLLCLLITHNIIQAQDFTVEIPSTEDCNNYFKPLKAGGTLQFQIKVKNNRSDTCTVSIDKDAMGVGSWVSIDNNSQELFPSQSKNFLLTINIPTNTTEGTYSMYLYFNAYAKGESHNNSFQYDTQWIIVDNSPPQAPSFSIGQKTSKTLSITNWSSWDQFSNLYTFETGSAANGIKEYKIFIETKQGDLVNTTTKQPSDATNHKFENLTPNVEYNACVKATDLVGYSTTTKQLVKMPPAQPIGLVFSNITYIGATLSWTPSAGATGYNVYEVVGGQNNKVNNTPVIGNSFNITGLEPDSRHTYNVIALSDVGDSDRSDNISVTTIMPYIFGPTTICTQGTYKIKKLLAGATVQWSYSGNVSISSGQNTGTAIFSKNGDGFATINAVVSYQGTNISLQKPQISVGAPLRPYIRSGTTTKTTSSVSYTLQYGSPTTSLQLFFIEQPGSPMTDNWITQITSGSSNFNMIDNGTYVTINPTSTGTGSFTVKSENQCGISSSYTLVHLTIRSSTPKDIIDPPELPTDFRVTPNPASDYITITMDEDETNGATARNHSSNANYIVQIWNTSTKVKEVQSNDQTIEIPISDLSTGTYYVRVIHNGQMKSRTIIKL